MSSTYEQQRADNRYAVIIAIPAILYTLLFMLPSTVASGYTSNSDRLSKPTSEMASKVLFHSPSLANIYKEMIVSSKPLSLRKYGNGSKVKKPKKDSKIYYIPIPPMPYRYIPGVGFDYQPTKIKPILQEESLPTSSLNGLNELTHISAGNSQKAATTTSQHTTLNQKAQNNRYNHVDADSISNETAIQTKIEMTAKPPVNASGGESKVFSMDRGKYYFNGRPFRLQVAHAQPKNLLTPLNLKSKLYFNKKIIY